MCVCARVSFVVKKAKAAPSLTADSGPLPANRGIFTFAKASRHSHPTPPLFVPSTFSHFSPEFSFFGALWRKGDAVWTGNCLFFTVCSSDGNILRFNSHQHFTGNKRRIWVRDATFSLRKSETVLSCVHVSHTHASPPPMCVQQLMLGLKTTLASWKVNHPRTWTLHCFRLEPKVTHC